ncbi:MAG TPA: GTP-binding protein [Planctomycetaceae bacterium]|nr:GTP-binding protein [Planctomycetaceae bacterium]
MKNDLDELVVRFHQKDRRALSRLLTLAAQGMSLDAIRASLQTTPQPQAGRVVGISGSGGVGKSSLIGRMIESLRADGETVAVLCCDPESPLTGGALLGDRVRIGKTAEDTGVFIRSLATPSGSQAVASNLDVLIALFLTYGFQTVILETVGAGQGDTAVRSLVDIVVVLLQPEAGDELQWEKAGLLEVADVVVIHKSDLPGSRRVAAQVREQLNLPGCREVPVLTASASRSEGLKELWETIRNMPGRAG